jgi:predicted nucleic acid-binding protein
VSRWFVDASVLIAARDTDDRHHEHAQQFIADTSGLWILDLARYEVTNIAIRRWGSEAESARLQRMIDVISEDGGLVRIDGDLAAHMTALAREHGLSAYDAGYVAGAARVGATLVSCDLRDLVEPGHAVTPQAACESR